MIRTGAFSTRVIAGSLRTVKTDSSSSPGCCDLFVAPTKESETMKTAFSFSKWIGGVAAAVFLAAAPAAVAQMTEVDPNTAIDADLSKAPSAAEAPPPVANGVDGDLIGNGSASDGAPAEATADTASPGMTTAAAAPDTTYKKDDLIGAAEGVFGKGAEGLAKLIEKILKDQGEPNAYIVGREAGGALVLGVRYGSGTLYHKIEGERPAYWTGPSVGFDAGANASKTFVLVYNLYDSEDLYKRFPAGEGAAYLLGGFNASYMRRGDVVLIPIRVGVGARLGANVGYMKFRKKQSWLPI
jgi:hypothetical protein